MDTTNEKRKFQTFAKTACNKMEPIQVISQKVDDFWIAGGFMADLYRFFSLKYEMFATKDPSISNYNVPEDVYEDEGESDVDIFFSNLSDFELANNLLEKRYPDAAIFDKEKSNEFSTEVGCFDLVEESYDSVEECLCHFDLNVVSCAYHVSKDQITFYDSFFEACVRNAPIEINTIHSPIHTLMRVKKYTKKGWEISYGDLLQLYTQVINDVPEIDNIEKLENFLESYSSGYGRYKGISKSEYEEISNRINQLR